MQINGCYLHLFNTHLQANYFHNAFDTYRKSIEYKIYQTKQLAEFIESKTNDMDPQDLILVMGDFNISSRGSNSAVTEKIYELSENVNSDYNMFLDPEFDHLKEYKIMIKLLSNQEIFKIKNFKEDIRTDGEDPITFADVTIDDQGIEVPAEVALTHRSDLKSQHSIDYIFEFSKYPEHRLFRDEEEAKYDGITKGTLSR